MSGIAGIIHFDGRPVAPGEVEAMTAGMHYRGPDGINHWRKGSVALGQCMLRTTPESLEENQPLTNEDDSLVLVMDGRVDNWEELRRELLGKGAVLRTRADAELVLRAYEIWGRECLTHIDGDFALVMWDARKREAFCARDRVGNRPFHYYWNGRSLVFASDLRAILSLPWIPQAQNDGTVAEYLATDWYSQDETLWQDILRLIGAHLMIVNAAGAELRRYWTADLQATLPCRSDEDYIEHYRGLFTDVVRRMSRSHRPLACEVSGGLDSSAIFAVAETQRQQRKLLAPGLEGYTLDFQGDSDADELSYARAVGSHLGRAIREIAPAHRSLEWLKSYARFFGEMSEYPNHTMIRSIESAARADGSRVLLSGTGGDEWVGGGQLYYAEAIAGLQARQLWKVLRDDYREAGVLTGSWWCIGSGVVPLLPKRFRIFLRAVISMASGVTVPRANGWLASPMRNDVERRRQRKDSLPAGALRRVGQRGQIAALWSATSLVDREMRERQTAHMGLEIRRPFWNARIIEAAIATPEYMRCRGHENKWMHRRAMTGILPEAVLGRQSKAIFNAAFSPHWNELRDLVRAEILPRRHNWVMSTQIEHMLSGVRHHNPLLWPDVAMWVLWSLFGVDAVFNTLSRDNREILAPND